MKEQTIEKFYRRFCLVSNKKEENLNKIWKDSEWNVNTENLNFWILDKYRNFTECWKKEIISIDKNMSYYVLSSVVFVSFTIAFSFNSWYSKGVGKDLFWALFAVYLVNMQWILSLTLKIISQDHKMIDLFSFKYQILSFKYTYSIDLPLFNSLKLDSKKNYILLITDILFLLLQIGTFITTIIMIIYPNEESTKLLGIAATTIVAWRDWVFIYFFAFF